MAAPRPPGAVTVPVADPLGPIARHLAPSPPDDRTFARRRLASLAGVLALVLAVGSLVGGGQDDVVAVTTETAAADAGGDTVRAASLGSPSGVRALLSETTTTLVEATGATTTTTAPVPVTAAPTTSAVPEGDGSAAPTTTEAAPVEAMQTEPAATEAAPTTTAPPRPAPTTTAAPRRAPSTTAAPTTTTTQPPPPSEPSGDGYAYDDPRSTQVWYDLAQCESGGNWSINTGNGYYGGLQFALATWESVGGSGYPHEHPAATQIDFGRKLQARQGWGAWPHCSEKLGLR